MEWIEVFAAQIVFHLLYTFRMLFCTSIFTIAQFDEFFTFFASFAFLK